MNLSMGNRMKGMSGILLPVVPLILFMAGCGPSQKEMAAKDQMERARNAYAAAKADPNVGAYAPLQLQDAGIAVQAAEKAEKPDDMIRLGYIGERRSQEAMTVAEGKVAEKEIDKLNTEKAELIAQKQTLVAKKARAEAERARAATAAEAEEKEAAKKMALAEKEKAAMAAAKAEQNRKMLAKMNARVTERGIALTLTSSLFPPGKAELSPHAYDRLALVADFLKQNPDRNVLVEGHTDDVGEEDQNWALSLQRAQAVKARLFRTGVDSSRITAVGYGEKFPVESNKTSAGRSQNRRVDLIILNEGVRADSQIRR